MICPKCGGKTRVRDNVNNEESNENYRKRVCQECGHKFYTVEFEVETDDHFKKSWSKNYRHSARLKRLKEMQNGRF